MLKATVKNLNSIRVQFFPLNSNGSYAAMLGKTNWTVVSGPGSVIQNQSVGGDGGDGEGGYAVLSTPQVNGDTVFSTPVTIVKDNVTTQGTVQLTLTYGPDNGAVPVPTAFEISTGYYISKDIKGQQGVVLGQANL